MAKKATTQTEVTVNKVEAPVEAVAEAKAVAVAVEEPVAAKPRTIIAKEPTPLRKTTSTEAKQVVGKMTVGVAYEIVKEVSSKIYGDFYKLSNGYYITKSGNYVINN